MSPSSSFSIPVFDQDSRPSHELLHRKMIYLDSSVWIELAERQRQLAESCAAAVAGGSVLFPLSFPTICELIDQPDPYQQREVADLMDRLSLGVSFRPGRAIDLLEADAAFLVLLGQSASAPGPSSVLSWIGEYLGTASMEFSSDWSDDKATEYIRHLRNHPSMRTVRWLIDHGPVGDMQRKHKVSKERYVEQLSAGIDRGSAAVSHIRGVARRKRLLREEWQWLVNKKLAPRFRDKLIETVGIENVLDAIKALNAKIGEGSEERLLDLMRVTPSMKLTCEIMAARTADNRRRVRKQDFHDVEHALIGAPYAEAFVTQDKGLRDLLRRCATPSQQGCRVQGIDSLLDEL